MVPYYSFLVLEEAVVGPLRMKGYIKVRELAVVVNGLVQEVGVQAGGHHDSNEDGVGLVCSHSYTTTYSLVGY
jgi:hypothetical protein